MELTVKQLAERLRAELAGCGSRRIVAIGAIESAGAEEVTFVTDRRRIGELDVSKAAAVIVDRKVDGLAKPQLIVADVKKAVIEALTIFAPVLKPLPAGIDPTAKIAESAKISGQVHIGPGVVVAEKAEIDDGTVISGGCKIGENTKLGKNCRLDCNVVVYHNCTIGNNVIIQANSTIGAVGFGYWFIDGVHRLIPHNGAVVIEDFVEIGANCCIDRAKFGQTRIGAGTKIDNLVQIAHNVVIGKCCLIAGQTGVGGSVGIGDGVVLAGQVGISDNIKLGDGVMVGGKSAVMHDFGAGKQLYGVPAREKNQTHRIMVTTRRLPKIVEQLKQLTARVDKLEAAEDDKK